MRIAAFALALLLSGAASAQIDLVPESQAWEGDGMATTAFETEGGSSGSGGGVYSAPTLAEAGPITTGTVVEAGNADPERDARGIRVISAAAVVPAGWNGTQAGAAMGGPELDPATGEAAAPRDYPACTATITDKCAQTYEAGRL